MGRHEYYWSPSAAVLAAAPYRVPSEQPAAMLWRSSLRYVCAASSSIRLSDRRLLPTQFRLPGKPANARCRPRWSTVKPKALLLLAFSTGLVVGGLTSGFFAFWHWNRDFQDWYVTGVADQANVAREIYAGRSEQLADRIRESLPQYVLAIHREFRTPESSYAALRLVRDVYHGSSTEIPAEIAHILSGVPPSSPRSCPVPAPSEPPADGDTSPRSNCRAARRASWRELLAAPPPAAHCSPRA